MTRLKTTWRPALSWRRSGVTASDADEKEMKKASLWWWVLFVEDEEEEREAGKKMKEKMRWGSRTGLSFFFFKFFDILVENGYEEI